MSPQYQRVPYFMHSARVSFNLRPPPVVSKISALALFIAPALHCTRSPQRHMFHHVLLSVLCSLCVIFILFICVCHGRKAAISNNNKKHDLMHLAVSVCDFYVYVLSVCVEGPPNRVGDWWWGL